MAIDAVIELDPILLLHGVQTLEQRSAPWLEAMSTKAGRPIAFTDCRVTDLGEYVSGVLSDEDGAVLCAGYRVHGYRLEAEADHH